MSPENTKQDQAESSEHSTSPLSPTRLVDLFFRPRRYFSNVSGLDHPSALFIAASLMGIAGAMGRIDMMILQVELGRARRGWEHTASWLLSSWTHYWLAAILAGLVGAVFIWYLGGWWYRLRLQWSGAAAPSAHSARRVFTMQEFVIAGPTVILALAQTAQYANYDEAIQAGDFWSLSIVVFAFWSCWTSYVAATTAFSISKARARLWFLGLPALVYIIVFGVVGTVVTLFTGNAA
jgi:hypothetical protein